MKKTFLFMALVVVMVGVFLYSYSALAEEIRVGSIWPMTGPGAFWGVPFHNVIQFQADVINAKGGMTVGGKKYLLKIIKEDTKFMPAEARKATEKLIYQDKVKFILGPLGGGELSAVKPLLNDNKVINIVVVNAIDAIGPDKPYCFRSFMGVGEIYSAYLKYFRDNFGVKSFQDLQEDTESGRSAAVDIGIACRELGVKNFETVFVPAGTMDFYPSITKIVQNNPDLICTGAGPGQQAMQVKAARELGYKGLIHNHTPTIAADYLKVVDKKVMEGYFTTAYIVEGPLAPPGVKKWKGELSSRLTIPADAEELTVHVNWEDDATGLGFSQKVAAHPPSGYSDTLQVTIKPKVRTAGWAKPLPAKK